MRKRWLFYFLLLLATATAGAQLISIGTVDGGGSIATGPPAVRVMGAIDGFGLPDGYAALSQNGTVHLQVGYYPALVAQTRSYKNNATPAWLAVEPPRVK